MLNNVSIIGLGLLDETFVDVLFSVLKSRLSLLDAKSSNKT